MVNVLERARLMPIDGPLTAKIPRNPQREINMSTRAQERNTITVAVSATEPQWRTSRLRQSILFAA
jgi:hypothetical protein